MTRESASSADVRSRRIRRLAFATTLLGALGVALPAVAGDSFWDPPGEDPCDDPRINCLGGGALDQDNWAGAATKIGEAIDERAESDPVAGFILWLAKKLGPKTGGDDGDGDGDGDSEESSMAQLPSTDYTKLRFDDVQLVRTVRKWLDPSKEGDTIKLAGKRWKVYQKREDDRRDRDEYVAVLVPLQDARRIRKGKIARGITLRARAGKLYLAAPKRR